ncbi:alpha-amylase family glycosyl hydrolase [Ohtaekwangia kribbensis]|uniref:Alpha-amylase family glycosyl hydrolase n=1 Tax=Ohtaekwangia kribbensis TaxID=688913 RepID=A0ABW3JVS1_9BACT
MKKLIFFVGWMTAATWAMAQVTTSPVFPVADQPVTITVDVTGTGLENFNWNNTTNPVYIWAWLPDCSASCDAPTNVNPATTAQEAAKAFRITTNKFQITLTPTAFFNKPAAEITRMGFLLKATDWAGGKTPDYILQMTTPDDFIVSFATPTSSPLFKSQGEQLPITANVSEAADLVLKINNNTVASVADATTLSYTHTIAEAPGTYDVTISADNGEAVKTKSFQYIVRKATVTVARPAGIVDGINYGSDPTKVVLSLWAPGKSSVYIRGDFNDWKLDPAYLMNKDGEHFWIELTGLTAGQEYAYQYLVEESVWIADPYADKILDPDDQYIPASIYPNLKMFPSAALHSQWYFNRLAVFQTGQVAYTWQTTNYERPAKEKLIVYELLIRDFFSSDERSYQNLIDTIGYFKRLGANAIELMPIMEFNGNDSWGYNPAFMFAPDKYYGPKNKLKEFIDRCHAQGIAVIFDIAMNHQDMPNAYVMMDFDFTASKPTANNKWFNTDAKHPFNVFYDMNHESSYTKKYLDTVNYYWLNEYKIDGFRFDLSKGFTQTNNPNDVNAWSAYDASRIALLKRMADEIWSHSPETYIILEHLAVNDEEKELAEYRAAEGKGMMLWGNLNYAYGQNTMGYASGSDINTIYYANRNWTVPHLVGYMESHDEERIMFKNLQYGNSSGAYSIKTEVTALDRVKAASLLFYTIPGPKMLWQFGEMGYDESINRCPDGTISDDCRVSAKPVKWEYLEEPLHAALFDHTAELISLRKTYDVFTEGAVTITGGASLVKQVTLKNNPYTETPASTSEMNAQLTVNFELTSKTVNIAFPHTGTWYDYYDEGKPVQVTNATLPMLLPAGSYKLFTDVPLKEVPVTGIEDLIPGAGIHPNPTANTFRIELASGMVREVKLFDTKGAEQPIRVSGDEIDMAHLNAGLYLLRVTTSTGKQLSGKVIKK